MPACIRAIGSILNVVVMGENRIGMGDFKLLLNGREAFWLGCTPQWQQGDSDALADLVNGSSALAKAITP